MKSYQTATSYIDVVKSEIETVTPPMPTLQTEIILESKLEASSPSTEGAINDNNNGKCSTKASRTEIFLGTTCVILAVIVLLLLTKLCQTKRMLNKLKRKSFKNNLESPDLEALK